MDVVYGDIHSTICRVCDWIERAAEEKANMLLFPELILSAGYALNDRYHKVAELAPGSSTRILAKKAAEKRVYLVAGIAEKTIGGRLYDSAVVIDRRGKLLRI